MTEEDAALTLPFAMAYTKAQPFITKSTTGCRVISVQEADTARQDETEVVVLVI